MCRITAGGRLTPSHTELPGPRGPRKCRAPGRPDARSSLCPAGRKHLCRSGPRPPAPGCSHPCSLSMRHGKRERVPFLLRPLSHGTVTPTPVHSGLRGQDPQGPSPGFAIVTVAATRARTTRRLPSGGSVGTPRTRLSPWGLPAFRRAPATQRASGRKWAGGPTLCVDAPALEKLRRTLASRRDPTAAKERAACRRV